MRRALACTALILLVIAGQASAEGLRLSETAGPPFPDRAYLLTLPARVALQPGQVKVLENDGPVQGLSVAAGGAIGQQHFGTVLAIDVSSSMHGIGIRSSMAAARAFAAARNPGQPLGLVFFNQNVRVALPLTTDPVAIRNALATPPPLGRGTRIFDGLATASQMLSRAALTGGSVILLTDGQDEGSQTSQASAVGAAQAAHARVYAVGFRTRAFQPATLKGLAAAAGGSYITATSTAGASAFYSGLGRQLSNQYLIRYRSTAALGGSVRVVVRVAGQPGVAVAGYTSPAIRSAPVAKSRPTSSFWTSTAAFIIIIVTCAGLLGLAVTALLLPGQSVRARVARFVSVPAPDDERAWTSVLIERALGDDRRGRLERTRRWTAFARDLELAQIKMSAQQVAIWTVLGTVLVGWLLASLTGSAAGAILGLIVPAGVKIAIRILLRRQLREFNEQLPDNLQVIASAMRAGHTFIAAIGVVVEDAPEPSRREFRRVLADEQLGIPLADSLGAVAERMSSRDFEHVALVATLQRETGGNTAEVIDQVTETIRERLDLRRLIRTLTAQGRLAGFVVSGLPVFLLIAISVINPGYIYPMFHRTVGLALLGLAAVMLALGAWIISRIVDINV